MSAVVARKRAGSSAPGTGIKILPPKADPLDRQRSQAIRIERFVFFYWAVFTLASIGVIAGLMMIPNDNEVAYLNFKDKDFKSALVRYEAEYQAGNRSPGLLGPLCDLYLQYGQVNKAIAILEEALPLLPDTLEVRKRLSVYYQYAQRPNDYLSNLEAIAKIAPGRKVLRELAQIYNYTESYEKQAETLHLIISDFEADHEDFIALAYLYASQRRFDDALKVLDQLFERRFNEVTPEEIDFSLSLMLDLGQEPAALLLANKVIEAKQGGHLERITNLFQRKGALPTAYRLLEPFEAQENLKEGVLVALISVQIALKENDKALTRLLKRFRANTLPVSLTETLLDLVIETEDPALLSEFVQKADLRFMDEDHYLIIAKLLIQYHLNDDALVLKRRLPKQARADYWMVGVVLEVIGGGAESLDASQTQQNSRQLPEWRRLYMAKIYHDMHQDALAKQQLNQVDNFSDIKYLTMPEVVELYLAYDLSQKAHLMLEMEKRKIAGQPLVVQLPVLYGWMLNLSAMGRIDVVMAWIERYPTLEPELYRNLYFVAVRYQHFEEALIGAGTYKRLKPSPEADEFLANALVLNLNYQRALPLLRQLYAKAPNDWRAAYAEALYRNGQPEQWLEIWKKELARHNITEKERSEIGFTFLEHNYKKEAEAIFMSQAEKEGPEGPAVEQLIFLWGMRPTKDKIVWLDDRAQNSEGRIKAGWYRRLIQVGQAELLVAYVDQVKPWQNEYVMDLYLEHLGGKRDKAKFYKMLSEAIEKEESQFRLKRLAQLAGDQPLAAAAFQKLLKIMPENKEAIAKLGINAFNQGRFTASETYLAEAFSQGYEDPSAFFFYGELLARKNDPKAKEWFTKTLDLLKTLGKDDVEAKVLMAQAHWRLKETAEAIQIYRDLIAQFPTQVSFKAGLASWLMELGRMKEAEDLIRAQ